MFSALLLASAAFAADDKTAPAAESAYVAPTIGNIDKAAKSLADPDSTGAPALWFPAGPAKGSMAGRMVDYVRDWWLDGLLQSSESGISKAARSLADPNAVELPDSLQPKSPKDYPMASRAIGFVESEFVDPLARHAHEAAMSAARALGSGENGDPAVSAPGRRWGWDDILQGWGLNRGRTAAPGVRPRGGGGRPGRGRPSATPPRENRRDSIGLVKPSPGAPGRIEGRPSRLRSSGLQGTPTAIEPGH